MIFILFSIQYYYYILLQIHPKLRLLFLSQMPKNLIMALTLKGYHIVTLLNICNISFLINLSNFMTSLLLKVLLRYQPFFIIHCKSVILVSLPVYNFVTMSINPECAIQMSIIHIIYAQRIKLLNILLILNLINILKVFIPLVRQ